MRLFPLSALLAVALGLAATSLGAQGTEVAFGGLRADPTLPVEVTADQLSVSQKDGRAVFTGNVLVIQGEMRLSASEVTVAYKEGDKTKIEDLTATGGVTVTSGDSAAEGREAVYTIDTGVVVLSGDVVLTQGGSTMSGERLTVNLTDGTGRMEGRVRTVFQPGGN